MAQAYLPSLAQVREKFRHIDAHAGQRLNRDYAAGGEGLAITSVRLPSLSLSALQAAVVAAVVSGATGLEAAAVVTEAPGADDAGRAAVTDLAPDAPVIVAGPDGSARPT